MIDSTGFFLISEAAMTDLLVRGLDPSVIERLKAKAKRKGHSLQQEAKEILVQAVPITAQDLDQMFKEIDKLFPNGPIGVCIEDLIREERENFGE